MATAKVVSFDIETVGLPEWQTEDDAKVSATGLAAALHPSTCRVVQVNLGVMKEHETTTEVLQARTQEEEADVLKKALRWVVGADVLVTFNGKKFDVPVLRWRSAILGVPAPTGIKWDGPGGLLYPFGVKPHMDLRPLLNNGDMRAKGTLSHWAKAFGVYAEEQGGSVAEMVAAGKWEDMKAYGHAEARTLLEFYGWVKDYA